MTTRGLTTDGRPDPVRIDPSIYHQDGLKYSHFGKYSGDAENAIFELNTVQNNIKARVDSAGGAIMYTKYYDENMNEVRAELPDDAGRTMLPDEAGYYAKLNKEYFDEEKRIFLERQNEIDDAMDYATISDSCCRRLLRLKEDTYKALVKAYKETDGLPANLPVLAEMDPEMRKHPCSITYMRSLPSGSGLQVASISRLRFIVERRLPHWKKPKTIAEKENDNSKNIDLLKNKVVVKGEFTPAKDPEPAGRPEIEGKGK